MRQPPPETEKVALWILSALKAEYERELSLLKCRLFREVIAPTMQKHRLESADVDRGLRFLLELKCLTGVSRPDGRAVLPTAAGLQYLSSHEASQRAKTGWTLDRRLVVYGLIVAIIAILCTLALRYWV
jgi:hypothetical protein